MEAISRHTTQTSKKKKTAPKDSIDDESLQNVLRPVFILAKIVAIPYFERRFQLFDWTTAMSLLLGVCNAWFCVANFIDLLEHEQITFSEIGRLTFNWFTLIYFVLFIKLALEWPALKEDWHKMEEYMRGLPVVKASKKIALITIFYGLAGLFEHFLSKFDLITNHDEHRKIDMTTRFLNNVFAGATSWHEFAFWKGILTVIVQLLIATLWNFTDIFLITISIALSSRLKQLYLSLERVLLKDTSADFWRISRLRYTKISALTRLVNGKVSVILLLTLGNNLYSICITLLKTLKLKTTLIQMSYFLTSLSLVFMRVFGVCLAAAKIQEIRKDLLTIVFATSSNSYNAEVEKFINQIKDDALAINCCQFFRVTRNLFLNVVGTIVTYEVVLLQVDSLKGEY